MVALTRISLPKLDMRQDYRTDSINVSFVRCV